MVGFPWEEIFFYLGSAFQLVIVTSKLSWLLLCSLGDNPTFEMNFVIKYYFSPNCCHKVVTLCYRICFFCFKWMGLLSARHAVFSRDEESNWERQPKLFPVRKSVCLLHNTPENTIKYHKTSNKFVIFRMCTN